MRPLLIGLIFVTIFCGALAPGAPFSAPQERSLVLIERARPKTAEDLLAADVVVVREFGRRLLAVTGKEGLAQIEKMGLRYTVLDTDITGKTYYTAYLRDERTAGFAASLVNILEREGVEAVVRASPKEADALAAEGIELAQVFLTPMRVNPPTDPILPPLPLLPDPRIQEMVASVSITRIDSRVQRLQDFVTRYSDQDSCLAAAHWIKSQFESFGIDSVYFHVWSPQYHPNVVAVLPGAEHPEKIVIIGGHYDSVTSEHTFCPGADDNASGTAAVLECAQILSQYEFDYTVVLIAFCGEELGLLGSEYYATEAAARGDDIVGMVAVDMIGYVEPNDQLDLDIIDNESSAWMRDRVMAVGTLYVPELSIVHGTLTGGSSDHASFWRHGYDAIMFFEDSNQYFKLIHTFWDVVGTGYISPTLAERSVKTAVAFIADLAGLLPPATAVLPGQAVTSVLTLEQNFPNPFNPETTIRFAVPAPAALVTLDVYDVAGRLVVSLVDGEKIIGPRAVRWDGKDRNGREVPTGVYVYRLSSGKESLSRKLVLLR
jgi:hypothetical protein